MPEVKDPNAEPRSAEASAPVLVSWSGGKDCALALEAVREAGRAVAGLLTTVTEDYDRISMHGIRRSLLHAQAEAMGLPLREVFIPPQATNETYEQAMTEALAGYAERGVRQVIFGDIYLEDVRAYREALVEKTDQEGLFPLWQQDTAALARRFLERGFKARIACVDTDQLDASFAGRRYDEAFLQDLPPGADPCGENGEFHTFLYDGPLFSRPIAHEVGEVVLRDERFAFCDFVGGEIVSGEW